MKYIKTYEQLSPKFNEGDIVKVKFKMWDVKGEKKEMLSILEITKIHNKFGDISYACFPFEDDKKDTFYIKEKDIIETVSREQARILFDMGKYNL